MSNKVEHPDYYGWIPGIECMAVVRHFDFLLGNVIKYCWRAGRKGSEAELDDLKKAVYYLQEKIKMVEEKIDTVSDEMICASCHHPVRKHTKGCGVPGCPCVGTFGVEYTQGPINVMELNSMLDPFGRKG